jgi:hypothetical protein
MRRLFVFIAVLGMLFALPVATASAQTERFEATINSSGAQVGVTADGAAIAEGTFEVVMDGEVVETGQVRSVIYSNDTASHFSVKYRDDSTGDIVNTTGKAYIVAVDEVNGIVTFAGTERIVSSTTGVKGHAVGEIVVFLHPDGSFTYEGSAHWILNF